MRGIRKDRVKRLFNRSASRYDRFSEFQREISNQLLLHFPDISGPSKTHVLDIGCGTGNLGLQLSKTDPDSHFYGCDIAFQMAQTSMGRRNGAEKYFAMNGDAETLPVKNGTFHLVVSNLVFQWMSNYKGGLEDAFRVLKRGGQLVYSVYSQGTLSELHESYLFTQNGANGFEPGSRLHRFPDRAETICFLRESGFEKIEVVETTYRRYYKGALDLLELLKNLGASNAMNHSTGGLGNRRWVKEMVQYYDSKFSYPSGVLATWVVQFVRGHRL